MKKGWREWIEKVMAARGISQHALKTQYHFSPDTFKGWEAGAPARPHTMRKLAGILQLNYRTLVEAIGIEVVSPVPPKRKATGA